MLDYLADQILFITVTTNPKWTEILGSLTPGQQPHDRRDLLVRVFRLKIQNLWKILKGLGSLEATVLNFKGVVYRMHNIIVWLSHDGKLYLCNYCYLFICEHCQALSLELFFNHSGESESVPKPEPSISNQKI